MMNVTNSRSPSEGARRSLTQDRKAENVCTVPADTPRGRPRVTGSCMKASQCSELEALEGGVWESSNPTWSFIQGTLTTLASGCQAGA